MRCNHSFNRRPRFAVKNIEANGHAGLVVLPDINHDAISTKDVIAIRQHKFKPDFASCRLRCSRRIASQIHLHLCSEA
jgi:hypothetical protein